MSMTAPFGPGEDAPDDADGYSQTFTQFTPLDITAGNVRFAGVTYGWCGTPRRSIAGRDWLCR
jgi:hypothetical protein